MKIEPKGSESAELSSDGSFVMIRIPVWISGEHPVGATRLRYTVGSFMGRESDVPARSLQTQLTIRVPKEIFRSRSRLTVEVFSFNKEGRENILWSAHYEAGWSGNVPHLQPVADLLGDAPHG